MEYGSVIYDSCTGGESRPLEPVQRRAALRCNECIQAHCTHPTVSWNVLGKLKQQKEEAKRMLCDNILRIMTPKYLREIIPEQVQHRTNYTCEEHSGFLGLEQHAWLSHLCRQRESTLRIFPWTSW